MGTTDAIDINLKGKHIYIPYPLFSIIIIS